MNLCSTFSLDGIHVHLKPPLEITPLKFLAWYRKLLVCNDPRANWVLDGIANGFKIGFSGGQLTSANQNMHSDCSHPETVDDYLLKELKRGSIAGPFKALPSSSLYINRFGLRRLRSELLNPKFGSQKSAFLRLKNHNFSSKVY